MHVRYTVHQCWVNLAVAAVIYTVFGLAAQRHGGAHAGLELVLGVVMAGVAVALLTDTAEARLGGLAATGIGSAVGAYVLVVEGSYLSGTIVSVIAFFQLLASAPCSVILAGRQAAQAAAAPVPLPQPGSWPGVPAPTYDGTPAAAYSPTFGASPAPPAPTPAAPTPPGPVGQPPATDFFGSPRQPQPEQ